MRSLGFPSTLSGTVLTLAAAVGLAACSDDGGGTAPRAQTIEVRLESAAVDLTQGQDNTIDITIDREGGFSGPVQLSLDAAPDAAVGAHQLTVRARGQGMDDETAALVLTVAEQPRIEVLVEPATLSVAQAASAEVAVTVARTNFGGTVNLSLEGAPAGVSGSFEPASLTDGATTSTLTLSAAADVAPGEAQLTIRAEGEGTEARAVAVVLTVEERPGIGISVEPAQLSLARGGTGGVVVRLTRGNFAGSVELSLENAPQGVTGTFAPGTLPSGAGEATLSLAIGGNAPIGNRDLVVRARGEGVEDATAALRLTISVPGSYALSVSPSSLAIAQGGTGTTTVGVQRSGGFTGAVQLSVAELPAGVTASFTPATVAGSSSTLRITAGAGAPAGSHALEIRGTASGQPDQTTTLTLQVASSTGNTALQFCPGEAPMWFAAQDGDGPWTQVPEANGRFAFDIHSGRGGIAYVHQQGATYAMNFYYASASELNALMPGDCPTKTVRTSASTGLHNSQLWITLGNVHRPPSLFATIVLENVADGPLDMVAATRGLRPDNGEPAHRFIVRRNVDIPHNGTMPALDFGTVEAHEAEEYQLTIAGLAQANSVVEFNSQFATPTVNAPFFTVPLATGPNHQWFAVPAALRQAGDLHGISVVTLDNPQQGRLAVELFVEASNRTVALGPQPTASPTYSVVTADPYRRPRVQYTVQSEYSSLIGFSFSQSLRLVGVMMTEAYRTGSAIDYTLPDLSDVSGFDVNWGLRPASMDAGLLEVGITGGFPMLSPAALAAPEGELSPSLRRLGMDGSLLQLLRRSGSAAPRAAAPGEGSVRMLIRGSTVP